MLQSSLRLFSSFRSSKKTELTTVVENVNIFDNSTTPLSPDLLDREIWHRQLSQLTEVSEYLETGYPPIWTPHLGSLKQITAEYLQKYEKPSASLSTKRDEILDVLVRESAERDHINRDIAILACLYALSIPEATRHLLSAADIDVARYLRLLVLTAQARNDALSSEENAVVRLLLRILSGKGNDNEEFQHLIEVLNLGKPVMLVSVDTIHRALTRSGTGKRLQQQLDLYLQDRKFLSAFRFVSWLHEASGVSDKFDAVSVLDSHFPSWTWINAWRPDIDRISRWEQGNTTAEQKKKLSPVFDLEGPDTATRQEASLKMASPHCFDSISVLPRSTETLEALIILLDKAYMVGPNAIDLFIELCVDNNPADEAARSAVEGALQTANDSYCNSLLLLLRTFRSQPTLGRQMSALTQALPGLGGNVQLQSESLATRVTSVMQAAQLKFCSLLESGTGEIMGLRIHDLANAVLKATSIHPNLSPGLLARIQHLPPRSTLEAIFDQLQDDTQSSGSTDARLKSYLALSLGGKIESKGGSLALPAIRNEVTFWNHSPDSSRKDLARSMENIRTMTYHQYTECLLVMLDEDDMYIREMRNMITLENDTACLDFTSYLARRRRIDQLQHDCWLVLLESIIREKDASFLKRMAGVISSDRWLNFTKDIIFLFPPACPSLSRLGAGLTEETLTWWRKLWKNAKAIHILLEGQGGLGSLTWLYFPLSEGHVNDLLDILKQENTVSVHRKILSYLALDGSNIVQVCGCIRSMQHMSIAGRGVLERVLLRVAHENSWDSQEIGTVLGIWQRTTTLTAEDKTGLEFLRRLLGLNELIRWSKSNCNVAIRKLLSEYNGIIRCAERLERERLRLRHHRPTQISALLRSLNVDNTTGGRPSDTIISNEIAHAVEIVGENEYELSFALASLNDIQRHARGVPQDSHMLLVRLSLLERPKFCVHFSSNDEGNVQHKYWQPSRSRDLDGAICAARPTMFLYYLSRNLNHMLKRVNFSVPGQHSSSESRYNPGVISVDAIYSAIQKLIIESPSTCLVCCGRMSPRLWKPATCSKACSLHLRMAPLEIRLHNLFVDPFALDLILTAIYGAADDATNLKLLPGCPVPKNRIKAVIDSLPPLSRLQASTNIQETIRGHDVYGKEREDLLSWLCLRFRGFMLTVPESLRIPSMPATQQFLILNSSHEKEAQFNAHIASPGSSGVVFHGTQISRLFLILTEGLKSMTGTPFMTNGNSGGVGVYCADDQNTSLGYSGNTGRSWEHSVFSNMRLMLGCELATYTNPSPGSYHVIPNHDSLLVRYVFLIPPNYQPPPRHHVEPAMKSAFLYLKSGLLS